jgi:hypothetical protein
VPRLRLAGIAALVAGVATLLTGVAVLAAACGGAKQGEVMRSQPDFVGWVTAIEPGDGQGALGRIVVESQTGKIVRRLVVTVNSDTRIFRWEASVTRPAGFADVARQDQARLWLAGPVPRSFPAQATARQVVVSRLH